MVTKLWSGEQHTTYETLESAYEETKIDLIHLPITKGLAEQKVLVAQ